MLTEPIDLEEFGEFLRLPAPGAAGGSLEFLQSIRDDPRQPIERRMRAAGLALPFEKAKLGTADVKPGTGLAAAIERQGLASRLAERDDRIARLEAELAQHARADADAAKAQG
jgi:hypothetical protein